MPLPRLVARAALAAVTAAVASVAALASAVAAPPAIPSSGGPGHGALHGPLHPHPLPHPVPGLPHVPLADRLLVTVSGSGHAYDAATYELRCHPASGTLPRARRACQELDGQTRWGRDPFAPVPQNAVCTRQYGGPAVARVRGNWAGRPVDARFSRADGCEIARWDRMSALFSARTYGRG
ncbi:SSI family serine proteinase inhibitor [Streptomyces sp. B1866]|uniref:SSI family serine proteinase inhibitor n=1 Tax=Streptomyces sp. B1866 TaxID=3075431 RepID=UPI002891E00F|nr:SSI family serine proteinase inhibitor [Streptomyces sp. B1866]MDT3400256.1 SSI family serine proteinase inhibitor [Streptomyces sp. B1866]